MSNDDKRKVASSESFQAKLTRTLRIDPRYSVLSFQQKKKFLNIFSDAMENAIRISRIYQEMFPGALDSDGNAVRIKVILLPDKSVRNFKKGICHVGVAPLRGLDVSSSEQINQVLYGETFDTLQIVEDWIRIRLHSDGYVGWVSSNQVTLFTENDFREFQSLPRVFVREKILELLDRPDSHQIREAVYGNQMAVAGHEGNFLKIKLPDGPFGYARKSGVTFELRSRDSSIRKLIETARSFEGISYVWGGRSTIGFDCSGFVQTVFRLNGIELPRDTDLQFLSGKFVGKQFGKMRPGDLLFFSSNGNKINHVAIFLGRNREIIHSSGFVRIDSLDPRRKNFNKRLFSMLVGARRVNSRK